MFNPLAFANAAPAGVAVLETLTMGGVADEQTLARLPFVPLQRTTVNGRWEGPLAELTITHTYAYTSAQCDRVLEAIYRFPLPGDAAVRKVVVTFGDVEIVAELKERRAAEQAYEEAKRQGQQAALTTRESADVFTLRVAGLQPDQEVVVETTCVLMASAQSASGGWSLRIPLTTAPQKKVIFARKSGSRRSSNHVAISLVWCIFSPRWKGVK
ncbi:MAG: VIT domain-containing protein, partial [Anaerolineae bacterium]